MNTPVIKLLVAVAALGAGIGAVVVIAVLLNATPGTG